jgi:hypothetical protein
VKRVDACAQNGPERRVLRLSIRVCPLRQRSHLDGPISKLDDRTDGSKKKPRSRGRIIQTKRDARVGREREEEEREHERHANAFDGRDRYREPFVRRRRSRRDAQNHFLKKEDGHDDKGARARDAKEPVPPRICLAVGSGYRPERF